MINKLNKLNKLKKFTIISTDSNNLKKIKIFNPKDIIINYLTTIKSLNYFNNRIILSKVKNLIKNKNINIKKQINLLIDIYNIYRIKKILKIISGKISIYVLKNNILNINKNLKNIYNFLDLCIKLNVNIKKIIIEIIST